jgi:hypothetical protein
MIELTAKSAPQADSTSLIDIERVARAAELVPSGQCPLAGASARPSTPAALVTDSECHSSALPGCVWVRVCVRECLVCGTSSTYVRLRVNTLRVYEVLARVSLPPFH